MSDLVSYAEQELRKAGLFDKDSDYDGDIGPAALEIVKAFSEQGHSGFSAALVTNIVQKLMKFEPLSPLTGEDDEWSLICDERTSQKAVYQNKRCFSVFKEDGVSYHVQGKIFREPNGACYTNRDSRVNIEFPYVPKIEYVDVDYAKDE